MHMNELKPLNSSLGFDTIIIYSSTEHDGLGGRYGMTAKDDAFLILVLISVKDDLIFNHNGQNQIDCGIKQVRRDAD
jgi:hypothetical protein